MSYAVPDVEDVVSVARSMGIHLGPDEAVVYRQYHPDSYLQALEENLSMGNMRVAKNTQPFNYTGHPALAMPVGKSSAGLPASMQLVGRFFDDPLLLRVACGYEHSVDWEARSGASTRELETVRA